VVNILPMMAQPEDSLSCSFTPVFDADNDALDYEFSWYSNGVLLAGETLAVLDAAFTAHGDVVSCEVRAFDGYDYSVAGMSSMTILDTTPPDAPNLNSIGNYLNNPNLSIDGSCEANCSLMFYCSDATNSWTDTLSCDANGSFSYNTTFYPGSQTSCFATCEDAVGNISNSSNSVSAELCSQTDTYELLGIGNSSSDPVDQWSALLDDGSFLNISGNILESDQGDWFVISSADDVAEDLAYGIDYYNFEVEISTGASDYAMEVYKGGTASLNQECPNTGYTSYSDFNQDIGEGELYGVTVDPYPPATPVQYRPIPSDTRSCGNNNASFNNCADDSTEYYIHVFRTTTISSCQHYELTITNGVW